jgi:hypothetical protein
VEREAAERVNASRWRTVGVPVAPDAVWATTTAPERARQSVTRMAAVRDRGDEGIGVPRSDRRHDTAEDHPWLALG